MSLKLLIDQISPNLQDTFSRINAGEKSLTLGLPRSARLPILAAIKKQFNIPLVLLTDRSDHALSIIEELKLWSPEAPLYIFPEPNPLFYENAPWSENTRRERLIVLTKLANYHIPGLASNSLAPIIVIPARALMSCTMPRRDFLKAIRSLKIGQKINLDEMLNYWHILGYERVNTVVAPGQFTRRGGILDIWPLSYQQPIRLELFGTEIETIRFFDPTTQITRKSDQEHNLTKLMICPAREFLLDIEKTKQLTQDHAELHEFYLSLCNTSSASILDYLPKRSLVLLDDDQIIQDTVLDIEEQSLKLRYDAILNGAIPSDFPVPYLSWAELEENLQNLPSIRLGPVISDRNETIGVMTITGKFSPVLRFGGRLKAFNDFLVDLYNKNTPIVIVSRQKSRLEELWKDNQPQLLQKTKPLSNSSTTDVSQQLQTITFIQGSLSEGWIYNFTNNQKIYLITDGEIFGFKPPEPRTHQRLIAEDPEALYADLQTGDYVVHIDHGIGIFIGLVSRTIDGLEREYLCVEYANQAQLFIPVYQADRLTRYVGPDSRTPTISHLGSNEWRSSKENVKEAVKVVAEDLLELYAKRNMINGFAFSKDTPWQYELEASFSYIETEDQIQVLNEVKRDMESLRPMDRLICGDVGYGKTEVALRAAFKCILDGKQVAMLVPTTILAQQHFNTFIERLSSFPVVVEMLSRFRTQGEQRQILNLLKRGAIDIIIGTHRILSGDVEFKDLGLLIIDEEQRFGVYHKEKIKQMRTEVDVLTLTATPIPRTLYMALTGVRDISTINTPPEERLPIITHVGPYSPDLVRKAILRELERGGQVFFVHNRVQTIGAMRIHLEKIIPEARIAIAHGQMPENELSQRMKQFTNGEIDVLLSTSIIESGLDIPNANTLVVDRADTFGLAQLYQLRGRVGRGAQRAYAYFFRHSRKSPSLEGRQRLETIAENTQLGAGFNIAMRDLEIRGTGDILGTRQSGHVATVGFHLYTHLLAQAVRKLRKSNDGKMGQVLETIPDDDTIGVSVDLPLTVYIPANYVVDKSMRIRLYRRLAGLRSITDLEAMQEEFKDRFGSIPEPVKNMFYQFKIKILTNLAGLSTISMENGQLALRYQDNTLPDDLPVLDPRVRVGKTAIWIPFSSVENWQLLLEGTLSRLNNIQTAAIESNHNEHNKYI